MKVAIIHDWLVTYAGAERVLEQMLQLYPEAELVSIVDFLPEGQRDFIKNKPVHTSFIQKMPFSKKMYRNYLPLMPLAIEQFDLDMFDLVITSSHAVAKGVITKPGQMHISYVHSPIRYAWDLQHQYLRESGLDRGLKGWLVKWQLHKIRLWDSRTANCVDQFITNSTYISKRLWKVYRRESTVIHPPVDVSSFQMKETKENFYLTASRMVPYKKIDLIVEAFNQMPDKRLVVIGDGPEYKKVASKAGKNIKILGYQSNEVLRDYMQRAKAFVFAAEEDFGIVLVEAQACGTPVIAYGQGGAQDIVIHLDSEYSTGILYSEQNTASLIDAVTLFEKEGYRILPKNCRKNAEKFSNEKFREQFRKFVQEQVQMNLKEKGVIVETYA